MAKLDIAECLSWSDIEPAKDDNYVDIPRKFWFKFKPEFEFIRKTEKYEMAWISNLKYSSQKVHYLVDIYDDELLEIVKLMV